MEYVVSGLTMLDVIRYADGRESPPQMGGIPLYGFCGMRPYTDSIRFLARVGKDFFTVFDPWFTRNKVDTGGLLFVSDKTPCDIIHYREDESVAVWEFFTGNWADAAFYRPHAEDLAAAVGPDTRGFYLCGAPSDPIFERLYTLRDTIGFKLMWEPNGIHCHGVDGPATKALLQSVDMASFNCKEAMEIFGLSDEAAVLDFLSAQPCEVILLHVGARGLYVLSRGEIYFIPAPALPEGMSVVDVTGCGNCATAAALVAWCEGNSPAMTGIMANVAASFNLRQKGPCPDLTKVDARRWAKELYDKKAYTKIK